MKSKLTKSFVKLYSGLDPETRTRARHAYRQWRANEKARSFKNVSGNVSARIDGNYRVLGYIEGETVFWFWIGKHDEYERKI